MSCDDCLHIAEFVEQLRKDNESSLSWSEFLYQAYDLSRQVQSQCPSVEHATVEIGVCPESSDLLVHIIVKPIECVDAWTAADEALDKFKEESRQLSIGSPPRAEFLICD